MKTAEKLEVRLPAPVRLPLLATPCPCPGCHRPILAAEPTVYGWCRRWHLLCFFDAARVRFQRERIALERRARTRLARLRAAAESQYQHLQETTP